jgi:hypothetical protein
MTAKAALRVAVTAAALVLGAPGMAAPGGASNMSNASEKIAIGTMSIVAAPAISVVGSAKGESGPAAGSIAVVAGGAYAVSGITEAVAGGVEILLTSISSGVKLSVKISGKTAEAVGMSVGTTVSVISETTGTLLVASGKVVAFIPSELGEALLSQKRLPAS